VVDQGDQLCACSLSSPYHGDQIRIRDQLSESDLLRRMSPLMARSDGSLRGNDLVDVGGRADVNRRVASAENVESDP
jgi:hypothetical protein